MNSDLKAQLEEMGPDFRSVVARLRAARSVEPGSAGIIGGHRGPTAVWLVWKPRHLVAASVLVLLGLGVFFAVSQPRDLPTAQTLPRGAHEYHMGISEMIATQNADGSWQNDFLTRRNAELLKSCGDSAAQIAYKKAVRNLRVRGIL